MKKWNYQVVEIKPAWTGSVKKDVVQAELARLGLQGWELVSTTHSSALSPLLMILKKEF